MTPDDSKPTSTTGSTDLTVQDILEKTITILEERGWLQGAFTNTAGNVCLAKAFCVAAGVGADLCVANTSEEEPVQQFEGASATAWWLMTDQAGQYLPDFNDDPHTTYEDVTLLIKKTIVQADQMADAMAVDKSTMR